MKRSLLVLLVCTSALLNACSSSSTSPSTSASLTPPGVGSWYKFSTADYDSTGAVIKIDTLLETVRSTSIVIGANHDGVEIVRSDGIAPGYFRYLSNGDLEYRPAISSRYVIVYPFGSQVTQTLFLDTTIVNSSGDHDHSFETVKMRGSAMNSLSYRGASLSCQTCTYLDLVDEIDTLAKGGTVAHSARHSSVFWYAPAIKFVVYGDDLENRTDATASTVRATTLLDYYLVK